MLHDGHGCEQGITHLSAGQLLEPRKFSGLQFLAEPQRIDSSPLGRPRFFSDILPDGGERGLLRTIRCRSSIS